MDCSTVALMQDRHRSISGEKSVIQFGGSGYKIAGATVVGILLLTGLMVGTLWLSKGSAFSRGVAHNGQRAHHTRQALESAGQPSAEKPQSSETLQEKPDPTGAPAGMLGCKTTSLNASNTPNHLEALHPPSEPAVKSHHSTVEAVSQRTHRSGLYAVLLLLLANNRH